MTWWRDSRQQTRLLLVAFGVVALFGMLITGFHNYLFAGDSRQLVVTMAQGVAETDRETLKQACGSLPGVSLVADQGAADRQYRFPVRFRISDATAQQEAALETCVDRYRSIVRGVETERDR